MERATNTLGDMLKTWVDQAKSNEKKDFFTPEKLAYYFYQAMNGI